MPGESAAKLTPKQTEKLETENLFGALINMTEAFAGRVLSDLEDLEQSPVETYDKKSYIR